MLQILFTISLPSAVCVLSLDNVGHSHNQRRVRVFFPRRPPYLSIFSLPLFPYLYFLFLLLVICPAPSLFAEAWGSLSAEKNSNLKYPCAHFRAFGYKIPC